MPQKQFILRHVFTNVGAMKNDTKFSHCEGGEEYFGVPWFMAMRKHEEDVNFDLYCDREYDEKTPWAMDAKFVFRVTSCTPCDREKPAMETVATFDSGDPHGTEGFLTWDDVVMYHLIDGTVTIECHVTLSNVYGTAKEGTRRFNVPDEHLTDVILRIGDNRYHVLKGLLAVHSPYFKALFYGRFSESSDSEVLLQEVDTSDFHYLLESIYGDNVIQAGNVEGILQLADAFDVKMVREKCEHFLKNDAKIDRGVKLRLADFYNLEGLKRECLDSITSMPLLRVSLPSATFTLSQSTLAALLDKTISFMQ